MDKVSGKVLALTFDDGPNNNVMVQIIELLNRYDAKATFFVVGNRITEVSAPVLLAAAEQGFEIGNHSENHLHMTKLSREQIAREIASVQERVEAIIGRQPVLFRPPYIDVDDRMLETINMPFIAGSGNRDWDPDCTAVQRAALALQNAKDGAILLMHCFEGNEATVEALRVILPELKQRGYRMVTVSRLFEEKRISLENGVMYGNAVGEGN